MCPIPLLSVPWGAAATDPATPAGDVSIGIKCAPGVVGPLEADIDFDIIKNDNDTFTVKYTAPGPGLYTIMVLFANQVRVLGLPHIPEGPSPTLWGAPSPQGPDGAGTSTPRCPHVTVPLVLVPRRSPPAPSASRWTHPTTPPRSKPRDQGSAGRVRGRWGGRGGHGVGVMGAVGQILWVLWVLQ